MKKITTHLWYDKQAREAATLYTSAIPDSSFQSTTTLHDTPSGSVDIVKIELPGQELTLMSAGPLFKFSPAISFLISCATADEVDGIWNRLSEQGTVMMPLGAYPFSERYGWTQDRYGLSWQVMFAGARPIVQKITPVLMFTGNVAGKAEEAMRFYASVFNESSVADPMRNDDGTIKFGSFTLEGKQFAALNSAHPHGFTFNEAISFVVHCDTQEEIDHCWSALSADPRAEQCGWLKDRYGVSWQIVPTILDDLLGTGDQEQTSRVTAAFLQMKKFDIAALKKAAGERALH